MAHSSRAKKNKHYNKKKIFEQYLYKDHIPTHLPVEHLPAELKAEMDENIVMMRRRLRQTIRKLQSEYEYDTEEFGGLYDYHKVKMRRLSY